MDMHVTIDAHWRNWFARSRFSREQFAPPVSERRNSGFSYCLANVTFRSCLNTLKYECH